MRRPPTSTPFPCPPLVRPRPDLSLFPRAAWHAALGRALKTLPDVALGYGDPRGYGPLREALAAYLGRARGVVADPSGRSAEHTAELQSRQYLVCRLLLETK